MISTAFILGLISVLGFIFIFEKTSLRFKKFVVRHQIVFDIIVTVGLMVIFGGTGMGLFSAAFAGIFFSIYLKIKEYIYNSEEKTTHDKS